MTKLANFVQFKRMLMFFSWGLGAAPPCLVYATEKHPDTNTVPLRHYRTRQC